MAQRPGKHSPLDARPIDCTQFLIALVPVKQVTVLTCLHFPLQILLSDQLLAQINRLSLNPLNGLGQGAYTGQLSCKISPCFGQILAQELVRRVRVRCLSRKSIF